MDTQPFAFGAAVPKPPVFDPDEGRHGQVIDLQEVRRRLAEKKDPTPKDFLEALNAERTQVDRLTVAMADAERDKLKDNKHFGANVSEVANPLIAAAIQTSYWKIFGVAVVVGLVLLALAMVGVWSHQALQSRVSRVEYGLTTKADQAQVDKLATQLATKAEKSELKAIEAKADRSVVERLSQELKDKDGAHDARLNDLATDLMSKANQDQVEKLSARLRSTRSKVRSLEQRMKEISAPSAVPVPVVPPKTF